MIPDIISKKELLNNLIIKFDMEDILKKLIEYPTISESSNVNLMSYIDDYLKKFDIKGKLIQGEKNQFNYHCMIGPNQDGGIIFSGQQCCSS